MKSPVIVSAYTNGIPLFLHPDGKTVGVQSIGMTGQPYFTRTGITYPGRFHNPSYPPEHKYRVQLINGTTLIPSGMAHGVAQGGADAWRRNPGIDGGTHHPPRGNESRRSHGL